MMITLCTGLALAVSGTASAAVRPWLTGSVGGAFYAMGDVNDDIANINAFLAGSGLSMDEINKGAVFGAAIGLDLGHGFAVGLGYDRLSANSEVSDATGGLEYDLPANLVRGFGRYTFASGGKARGFLELGLGRVATAGEFTLTQSGVGSEVFPVEGSGAAVDLCVGGELWLASQFALAGSAGYRHAKASDIEVDGDAVYNAAGDPYSADYSGMLGRIGFTIALTK